MEPTPNPNVNPVPAAPTPENPGAPKPQTPAAGSPEFQPGASQGTPSGQPPQQQPQFTNQTQTPIAPGVPVRTQQPPQPQQSTTPPTASDDVDVIEKEWVDQAEEVIEKTKDDPHAEEEAVEDLQADYLKKRYGHDVKRSDDS